jgi:hypothetical protein
MMPDRVERGQGAWFAFTPLEPLVGLPDGPDGRPRRAIVAHGPYPQIELIFGRHPGPRRTAYCADWVQVAECVRVLEGAFDAPLGEALRVGLPDLAGGEDGGEEGGPCPG